MVVCIVVQNGFWTCQAAFCCRVSAVWGTLDWFILCMTELLSDPAGTSHQEWEMESTATRDSLTEQNVVCQPSITTKSESYSYDIISHVPDFIYVTQRDEGQSEHIIQLQHTMLLLIHQLYKKLYTLLLCFSNNFAKLNATVSRINYLIQSFLKNKNTTSALSRNMITEKLFWLFTLFFWPIAKLRKYSTD